MVTKTYKYIVGYGDSTEEAEESCKIMSILQDMLNIKGFDGLENRRLELAPWAPKVGTLHIRNVGYIRCTTNSNGVKCISVKGEEIPISKSLFSTLYRAFYSRMSLLDVVLCRDEIETFLRENKIRLKPFSTYTQVVPEDVFLEDSDIKTTVIFDKYSIIFYNSNKISIKSNTEELYWTCYHDNSGVHDIIDTIYYIAYVRKYDGITDIIKEDSDGYIYSKY